MHTFKRNLSDWYVSTNPGYPVIVSYYICHFLTDKIVCQEIFVQMLILTPVSKMKIFQWKDYNFSCSSNGCLSKTHARRWEKLFPAPPLCLLLSCLSMAFQAWKLQSMNQPCDTVYWQRVLSNYPYSSGMCQVLDLNQTTSDLSSHTQRLQAVGLEQVSWVYLKVVLIHGKILVRHCTCNHFVPSQYLHFSDILSHWYVWHWKTQGF